MPDDGTGGAIEEVNGGGMVARYEIVAGWRNGDAVDMASIRSAIIDTPQGEWILASSLAAPVRDESLSLVHDLMSATRTRPFQSPYW